MLCTCRAILDKRPGYIVTIQGMPQSAWGQSPRHLFCTNTKSTDAKFRESAHLVLSGGQSPGPGASNHHRGTHWMVTVYSHRHEQSFRIILRCLCLNFLWPCPN